MGKLKKDPTLVSKPAFYKEHPVVGEYITSHPKVQEIVKVNPKFFVNLTATTPGGEHGQKRKNEEKKQ